MAINHWESIDVTSSRRPLLLPGESSVYVQDGVGLYSGKHKVYAYQNGVIYLTEQRICYVDSAQPTIRSVALDLQYVDKIEHQVRTSVQTSRLALTNPAGWILEV